MGVIGWWGINESDLKGISYQMMDIMMLASLYILGPYTFLLHPIVWCFKLVLLQGLYTMFQKVLVAMQAVMLHLVPRCG
jgi:hypothetical protein